MSSYRSAALLIAVGLLTLGLGLGVVTEELRQAESWILGGAFAIFGAAMCAAGVLAVPRAKAKELPVVERPGGPLLVVPIRRARVLLLGFYAAMVIACLGFGGFWVLSLVRFGWQSVGFGKAAVLAGCGLVLTYGVPRLARWARSQGSVGWVLERRGIALPAGPGVRSIPWDAVTGVDLSDYELVFRGHSRTITWLAIRTADPSLYARAKELRPLHRQLGTDVTACVGVDMLQVRADVVLRKMRELLADPARRERLGFTDPGQGQFCAQFGGERHISDPDRPAP